MTWKTLPITGTIKAAIRFTQDKLLISKWTLNKIEEFTPENLKKIESFYEMEKRMCIGIARLVLIDSNLDDDTLKQAGIEIMNSIDEIIAENNAEVDQPAINPTA